MLGATGALIREDEVVSASKAATLSLEAGLCWLGASGTSPVTKLVMRSVVVRTTDDECREEVGVSPSFLQPQLAVLLCSLWTSDEHGTEGTVGVSPRFPQPDFVPERVCG